MKQRGKYTHLSLAVFSRRRPAAAGIDMELCENEMQDNTTPGT